MNIISGPSIWSPSFPISFSQGVFLYNESKIVPWLSAINVENIKISVNLLIWVIKDWVHTVFNLIFIALFYCHRLCMHRYGTGLRYQWFGIKLWNQSNTPMRWPSIVFQQGLTNVILYNLYNWFNEHGLIYSDFDAFFDV